MLTAAGASGYLPDDQHPAKSRAPARPVGAAAEPDPAAVSAFEAAAHAESSHADAELLSAATAAKNSLPVYPLNKPLYYVADDHGQAKYVALTIDDGPSPVYTPQVLQVLAQYKVKATFSMIGTQVASSPSLATDVAAAGHRISNHTWTHANLQALKPPDVQSQMTRASDAIHAATGIVPAVFRAPYGNWSPTVIAQCEKMEMIPLGWSVDPRDWARPGVTSIVNNIMANTHAGSIILEHDGGGDRSQTVAALRIVLPRLLDAGFVFHLP